MNEDLPDSVRRIARRHLVSGWLLLLLFVGLGSLLETLHAFKIGWYLDPPYRVRRELWTLAHAHGTLLAVVQLVFAVALVQFGWGSLSRLRWTSFLLLDAAILMPLGFFLGGIGHADADPSWPVILVPVGAALLLVAVALIACEAIRFRRSPSAPGAPAAPRGETASGSSP